MDTIDIISSFPKINKIDDLFRQSNEKQQFYRRNLCKSVDCHVSLSYASAASGS